MINSLMFAVQVLLLALGIITFIWGVWTDNQPLSERLMTFAGVCGVLSIVLWLLQKTIVLSLFSIGLV
jgi:hypothetical protein